MGRFAGRVGLAVLLSLLAWPGHARADVMVRIDKSSQRMSVMVNGEHRYTWPVSTGIYGTPSGTFRPQSLARYHRSTLYNNAPMPYSIFYDGNFAIHGTTHVSQLGGPASRGCIRLHPSNAAILFSLVQQQGLGNTRISITYAAMEAASTRGQIGDEVVHAVGEPVEHGKVQPIDRDENADPARRRQHHVGHKAGDAPALGQDQRAMSASE